MDDLKEALLEKGACFGVRDQLDGNHTHGEEVFKEYRERVGLGVSPRARNQKKYMKKRTKEEKKKS